MVKNLPSSAGDTGWIAGQGTGIPHAQEQLSLHGNSWDHTPQLESPCAATKTRHRQKRAFKELTT